jgi:hypothetical protein
MLLSFIFATVLIAYGTQIQLPTMKDTFEHGNNSRIWFRDMPVVKERNNSEAAATRLPTLYLSFEKLRLTHFEEISHVPLRDIGDYDKGVWMRKSMIDALWLRLFDDVDSLKHVCHLRLGAGYMAIMYLEALPDAEITIYDTCDGDQEEVCNTVESFLRINYPSRNITINRTSSPTEALVNENKSTVSFRFVSCEKRITNLQQQTKKKKKKDKTCDWIGLDFNGVNDAPRDIIASIQSIATCPNVLCKMPKRRVAVCYLFVCLFVCWINDDDVEPQTRIISASKHPTWH